MADAAAVGPHVSPSLRQAGIGKESRGARLELPPEKLRIHRSTRRSGTLGSGGDDDVSVLCPNVLRVQAQLEMLAYLNDRSIHDCAGRSIERYRRVFHASGVSRSERGIGRGKRRAVPVVAEVDPAAIIAAEASSVGADGDEVRAGGHGAQCNAASRVVQCVLRSKPAGSRPGHQRGCWARWLECGEEEVI